VIGRTAWELLGGEPSTSPWKEHIETLLARKPFYQFEVKVAAPDGAVLWVSSSGRPLFAQDGTFRGYRGIAVDITAHKRAEAEAREKAAFLEATLENMDQGLIMVDAAETVRVYNRKALNLLDLPEDLLGHPFPTTRSADTRQREASSSAATRISAGGLRRAHRGRVRSSTSGSVPTAR
jgi:PAS domain-containing protein